MVLVSVFVWWYSTGWLMSIQKGAARLSGILRFFSVAQLAGSLFAPFRQISAGQSRGSLGVQLQAWADKQLSRVIGAIVRLLLILTGLLSFLVMGLLYVFMLIIWPLVPLLPVITVVLVLAGWV